VVSAELRPEYPALFGAADEASNEAQVALMRSYKVNSALLILAACAALFSGSRGLAVTSAALFLASLAAHVYSEFQGLQKRWYQARALAESVKTTTWRFMMHAEPFTGTPQDFDLFRERLRELLSQNEGIAADLSGNWADKEQITQSMVAAHSATFDAKREFYKRARIDEQRTWYANKSQSNKDSSRSFFVAICVAYGTAILLVLLRVASPSTTWLPVEPFAVLAGGLIGWKQLRRFNELASAYGLTAHEVGIIQTRFADVADAAALGSFVRDAENAFSREHTQWAARRDHVR
jgi:hypothetical protein